MILRQFTNVNVGDILYVNLHDAQGELVDYRPMFVLEVGKHYKENYISACKIHKKKIADGVKITMLAKPDFYINPSEQIILRGQYNRTLFYIQHAKEDDITRALTAFQNFQREWYKTNKEYKNVPSNYIRPIGKESSIVDHSQSKKNRQDER